MNKFTNENYRVVLDAIDLPLFVHDRHGKIVFANQKYCQFVKKSEFSILNKFYWETFPVEKSGPKYECLKTSLTENQKTYIVNLPDKTFERKAYELPIENTIESYFIHVYQDISFQEESKIKLHEELDKVLIECINCTTKILKEHDLNTSLHQSNTSELAVAIAKKMGLESDVIEGIYFGTLLHDIGKIHVPCEILTAPRKLSEQEYQVVRKHPIVGYDIVQSMPFRWPIATMILQHHERLDGSGYPNSLRKEEIDLHSRILSVADVFEAMSSKHRPYHIKRSQQNMINVLKSGSDKIYDKEVVKAFIDLIKNKHFKFSEDL